jgi:enediyne biosynthesis protein E5
MPWFVPFIPVTSAAFTLFTLFMIPDPATTPIQPRRQVAFGLMVAAIYGLLFVLLHVVFALFIALCLTSAARGVGLYVIAAWKRYEGREEMAEIAGSIAAAAP